MNVSILCSFFVGVRMSSLLHESLCRERKQNTILGAFKRQTDLAKSDSGKPCSKNDNTIYTLPNEKDTNEKTRNENEIVKRAEVMARDNKILDRHVNDANNVSLPEASRVVDNTSKRKLDDDRDTSHNINTAVSDMDVECDIVTDTIEEKGVQKMIEDQIMVHVDECLEVATSSVSICKEQSNINECSEGDTKQERQPEDIDKGATSFEDTNAETERNENIIVLALVRKTRSGVCFNTPHNSSKKRRNINAHNSFTCPICGKTVICRGLSEFNQHVDECLENSLDGSQCDSPALNISDTTQECFKEGCGISESFEPFHKQTEDQNTAYSDDTSPNLKSDMYKDDSRVSISTTETGQSKEKEPIAILDSLANDDVPKGSEGLHFDSSEHITTDTEDVTPHTSDSVDMSDIKILGREIKQRHIRAEVTPTISDLGTSKDKESNGGDTSVHVIPVSNDFDIPELCDIKSTGSDKMTESSYINYTGSDKVTELNDIKSAGVERFTELRDIKSTGNDEITEVSGIKFNRSDELSELSNEKARLNGLCDTKSDDIARLSVDIKENQNSETVETGCNNECRQVCNNSRETGNVSVLTASGELDEHRKYQISDTTDISTIEAKHIDIENTTKEQNQNEIKHGANIAQLLPKCEHVYEPESGPSASCSSSGIHETLGIYGQKMDGLGDNKSTGLQQQESSGALLVCPVCNIEQRLSNLTAFNQHVDTCLSKGAITEILKEQHQVDQKTLKR